MRPSRALTRWATLLNRTLVLPHLLGRGSGGGSSGGGIGGGGGGMPPRAAFGRAYDLARARTGVSPVELIEIDRFAQLGIVPERLLQLRTRAASGGGGSSGGSGGSGSVGGGGGGGGGGGDGGDGYLRYTLPLLSAAAVLDVPLGSFSSDAIRGAFGGCGAHRVLGVTSLLGAFEHAPRSAPPQGWSVTAAMPGSLRSAEIEMPALVWLDEVALPALLAPAAALAALASRVASRALAATATAPAGAAGAAAVPSRMLGCVHLRRSAKARAACGAHHRAAATAEAPAWLLAALRGGLSCAQSWEEVQ